MCRRTAEKKAAERRYAALHAELPFHDGTFSTWGKEPSALTPFRFDDGVTIVVADTDLNPEDKFLG
ncbi:hypothetical protein [Nocardioides marmoraquaticus]